MNISYVNVQMQKVSYQLKKMRDFFNEDFFFRRGQLFHFASAMLAFPVCCYEYNTTATQIVLATVLNFKNNVDGRAGIVDFFAT